MHAPRSDRSSPVIGAPFVEVCVDSLAGARAAVAGGADQVELCAALSLGGLTPSAGLVAAVVAVARPAGVTVRAMVRPRAGDFAYDADDLAVAVAESHALLAGGVDGLVFGISRDGGLDAAALAAWHRTVAPPGFTLHRAIDTVDDPVAAVEVAIAVGADQILSSGGAASAPAGASVLAAMVARAGGRCRIVAGAGVRPDTVAVLAAAGIRSIHSTARQAAGAAARHDPFGFGHPSPPASEAVVRALRSALDMTNIQRDRTNTPPAGSWSPAGESAAP